MVIIPVGLGRGRESSQGQSCIMLGTLLSEINTEHAQTCATGCCGALVHMGKVELGQGHTNVTSTYTCSKYSLLNAAFSLCGRKLVREQKRPRPCSLERKRRTKFMVSTQNELSFSWAWIRSLSQFSL